MAVVAEGCLKLTDGSAEQSLRPGRIVRSVNGHYTAELEESDFVAEVGDEAKVYYALKRAFVQQTLLIETVTITENAWVDFQLLGEPVSAENRQCYRVSMLVSNLSVKVGPEEYCRLLDISASGFSVTAAADYREGQVVEATLRYEDGEFSGRARIQRVRPWTLGRKRYGLHHLTKREGGGELHKGMKHICMAVQGRYVRALAGVS